MSIEKTPEEFIIKTKNLTSWNLKLKRETCNSGKNNEMAIPYKIYANIK